MTLKRHLKNYLIIKIEIKKEKIKKTMDDYKCEGCLIYKPKEFFVYISGVPYKCTKCTKKVIYYGDSIVYDSKINS